MLGRKVFFCAIGALITQGMGVAASAQTITPTPETGVTPSTVVLYRDDLLPGREAGY
jgi:hypothetical protein